MSHAITLDSGSAKVLRQMSLFEKARAVLMDAGLEFAIVGGQAYSAQGGVGSALDFDILVKGEFAICYEIVKTLAVVQVVLFEPIDSFGHQSPRAKFIDFGSRELLDIIFSTSPFENLLVMRADLRLVSGVLVPVLAIADLILLEVAIQRTDSHSRVRRLAAAYPAGLVAELIESRMEVGSPMLCRLGEAAKQVLAEEPFVASDNRNTEVFQ